MNMADGRTRMGRMVWAAEEREEGEGGERREEKGRGGEGEGEGGERMKRARERERCGREYAEPQDWMVTEHEIRFM